MNKFSLCFNDKNLEEKYQDYQTLTVRKPLLIKVCGVSILWGLMDFIQFLIQNKEEQMTSAVIINAYAPFIVLQIIFLLITCFCKPKVSRWILLIQNQMFVFAYWMEYRLFTFEQAKFYTFIIIGTQFVILLSAECLEMFCQVIVYSIIYMMNMILENQPFTYSLIVGAALSILIFIVTFYNNTQKIRQHFKQHFLEDQWENIYTTLTPTPYMTFDYDEQTNSFNFRNQNKFDDEICNTHELRVFLRQTAPKGKNQKSLESFLYSLLHDAKQSVIKQNLELVQIQQNSPSLQNKEKILEISYSIFMGVNNIIVFQPRIIEENLRKNTLMPLETYQCKFKVLMFLAKKYIHGQFNFYKFKRYYLFSRMHENLKSPQYFQQRSIIILKFLCKIQKLYPDKTILIKDNCKIKKVSSNLTILAALVIGIIERITSFDIQIEYYEIENGQVEFTFFGYFNKEYFNFIKQKVSQFSIYTPSLFLDQFSINCQYQKYNCELLISKNNNLF